MAGPVILQGCDAARIWGEEKQYLKAPLGESKQAGYEDKILN